MKLLREAIEEMAEEMGWELREDYAGRFMFGKTCMAVVGPDANAILEEAGSRGIRGGRVDNMGRGFVVYWPSAETREPGS